MSLNRYEHALYSYLESNPDELRHWRGKVQEATRRMSAAPDVARGLERELWDYLTERSEHVPALRNLHAGGVRRVSLLNLSEYLCRVWGPTVPARRPPSSPSAT